MLDGTRRVLGACSSTAVVIAALLMTTIVVAAPEAAHAVMLADYVLTPTTWHGRVTVPADPGIEVTVYEQLWVPGGPTQPWVAVATATTAPDGSWTIGPYRAGWAHYTFGFEHPSADWTRTYWNHVSELGMLSLDQVYGLSPDLHMEIVTALRGTGTIRGMVRTAAGQAVSGATVSLRGGLAANITTVTASDGSYSLEAVPPGDYVVGAEEYRSGLYLNTFAPAAALQTSAATFTIGAGQVLPVDIEMRTATRLSGVLRRSDGRPASQMYVALYKWNERSEAYEEVRQWGVSPRTDSQGRWNFLGQTAGRYKVGFYAADGLTNVMGGWYRGALSLADAVALDLGEGETATLDDTVTVGGELRATDVYNGASQAPQWIRLWKRSGIADAWEVSRFERLTSVIRAIPAGTYRVELLPTGEQWGQNMRTIFYGDSETIEGARDVQIVPGGVVSIETASFSVEALSGKVSSAFSGEVVGGAVITLWTRSADGDWSVHDTCTSAVGYDFTGPYAFEDLHAGTYRMTVSTPDGSFRDLAYPTGTRFDEAQDIVIERGQRLTIDPRLQPVMGTIEGTVRDSITGQPIPQVRIPYYVRPRNRSPFEWLDTGPAPAGTLVTDAQGRYHLDYERFEIAFSADDPSGLHTGQKLDRDFGFMWLQPDAVITRDVYLHPRSRFDITVVDSANEQPLEGMIVTVEGMESAVTGSDGRWISPLFDSTWRTVTVADPSGRYLPFSTPPGTWIDPGEVVPLTVRLARDASVPDEDTAAPVTTADVRSSYVGIGTITLSASDGAGGGVAHVYHALDGGAPTEGSWFTVTTVGPHQLQYWSVDLSGNVEARHVVTFSIASAPPRTLHFTEALQLPRQRWDFDDPLSATVDEAGTTWVAMYDRVRRFTEDGTYIGYDRTHASYVRRAIDEGVWALSSITGGRIDHLSWNGTVMSSIVVTACAGGQLSIRAVAPADSGDVYVTDAGGGRVLRYGADGGLRQVFGFDDPESLLAGAPGGMSAPYGAAVDESGTVYVAESGLKQIQIFAFDGTPGAMLPCATDDGVTMAPLDVDYAGDGELLVNVGPQIWRFSTDGRWLGVQCSDPEATTNTRFQRNPDGSGTWTDLYGRVVRSVDEDGAVKGVVGSRVDHAEIFQLPNALVFGADGRGYLTDSDAHVHMIDDSGAHHGTFELPPTPGRSKRGAVALDASGNVYVPDPDLFVAQVNMFSPDGTFIRTVLSGEQAGPGIGIAPNGHLYVTDFGDRCVLHLDSERRHVGSWRSQSETVVHYLFDQPLAISPAGEVLVGQASAFEEAGPRVFRYGADGTPLGELAPSGEQEISGIACSPDGTIFVADKRSARVEYFSASGVYQGSFSGPDDMPFVAPKGLAFDRFGRLWVTDGNGLRCFSVHGVSRTCLLTYEAGTGGSLAGSVLQTVPEGGSGITVTALPARGHRFVRWSDGVLTATRTDRGVASDASVTAHFEVINVAGRRATYLASEGGTISGPTAQMIAVGRLGETVTAMPHAGYRFTGWSDGVQTARRTDLVVLADLTVTANFAALPKAHVHPPIAPSTMYRNRSAMIRGYVSPRHDTGTYLVTLIFYRRNASGVYVYHHEVRARRYRYSTTRTEYRASVSLPHRGTWRVRALHADAAHAPGYSGYDYITVK